MDLALYDLYDIFLSSVHIPDLFNNPAEMKSRHYWNELWSRRFCSRLRPEPRSADADGFLHEHRGQSLPDQGRRRTDATPPHSPAHCTAPRYLEGGHIMIHQLMNSEDGHSRANQSRAPVAGRMENRRPSSVTTGFHVNSAAWLRWFCRVTELLYADWARRLGSGWSTSKVGDSSSARGMTWAWTSI